MKLQAIIFLQSPVTKSDTEKSETYEINDK